jgi:hypothetical protein
MLDAGCSLVGSELKLDNKNGFSMLNSFTFTVLLCQGYKGTSYGGQAKIDVWLSKCVDEGLLFIRGVLATGS